MSAKAKAQSRPLPPVVALINRLFRYDEDPIKAIESEDEVKVKANVLQALEKGADVNTKMREDLSHYLERLLLEMRPCCNCY